MRKFVFGVFDQFDSNRGVQPQKMARVLKFKILEAEGLAYQCSINIGADQLRSKVR